MGKDKEFMITLSEFECYKIELDCNKTLADLALSSDAPSLWAKQLTTNILQALYRSGYVFKEDEG